MQLIFRLEDLYTGRVFMHIMPQRNVFHSTGFYTRTFVSNPRILIFKKTSEFHVPSSSENHFLFWGFDFFSV
jgi:hypothetical protein